MIKSHTWALGVFILLACAANVVWIRMNTAPPRTMDDAQYLAQSVDLYYSLKEHGIKSFLKQCLLPARSHPPMMKILPVPLYLIYKPSTPAALYAYTLLIPVFCIYLFLLTRALFRDDDIALWAVIITGCFPLTYGLWRHMLIEFGMGVAVVAALYHLVQSHELRVRRHVMLFGLFLAWGLLWKILFPLFVAAPLGCILVRRLRSLAPGEGRALARNLLWLAAVVGLIAGPFYVYSGRSVMAFAWYSIQDPEVDAWGLGPVFSLRTLWRYGTDMVNYGVSVYFFALLVVFGVLYLARRRRSFPRPATFFLLAWVGLPLAVASSARMKELRYTFPIYPAFGILLAALLFAELSRVRRGARRALLSLLLLYPVYQFLTFSFDLPWLPRKDIAWGPFALSVQNLEMVSLQVRPQYTFPAKPVRWPLDAVVRTIPAHAGDVADRPVRVLIPGMNLYFNWDNLTYEAKLQRAPLRFHGTISNAHFLIMLTGPDGRYGPLDYRDHRLQRLLDDRRLPFTEADRVRLPDQDAVIYKRPADDSPAGYRPWSDLQELIAYGASDFNGARDQFAIGPETRPVMLQTAETDVRFSYIYIPRAGATLRYGLGINPATLAADCPRLYQLKVAEMGAAPAEERTLLSQAIDPASNPEDQRWHDAERDLSPFGGKVIEIILSARARAPEEAACNPIGWSDLKLVYPN